MGWNETNKEILKSKKWYNQATYNFEDQLEVWFKRKLKKKVGFGEIPRRSP